MTATPWFVVRWRGVVEPSVEMLSATVTFGWCLLLWLRPESFMTGRYDKMLALGPTYCWGTAMLFSAAFQLCGVIIRRPPVRWAAQTLAAAQWAFCGLVLFQSTGLVSYSCLAFFLAWRTLRQDKQCG